MESKLPWGALISSISTSTCPPKGLCCHCYLFLPILAAIGGVFCNCCCSHTMQTAHHGCLLVSNDYETSFSHERLQPPAVSFAANMEVKSGTCGSNPSRAPKHPRGKDPEGYLKAAAAAAAVAATTRKQQTQQQQHTAPQTTPAEHAAAF